MQELAEQGKSVAGIVHRNICGNGVGRYDKDGKPINHIEWLRRINCWHAPVALDQLILTTASTQMPPRYRIPSPSVSSTAARGLQQPARSVQAADSRPLGGGQAPAAVEGEAQGDSGAREAVRVRRSQVRTVLSVQPCNWPQTKRNGVRLPSVRASGCRVQYTLARSRGVET